MAKHGFEVTLVVANGESGTIDGVRIVGVPALAANRMQRMKRTVRAVIDKALELDADIYHLHDPELIRALPRLKSAHKKVIYDVHEDVPRQILAKPWIPRPFRKMVSIVFERYENKRAARMDHIVAATPFIRDRFMKVNERTTDINNYPILEELVPAGNQNEPENEICYVGGISVTRGITELIQSLEHTGGVRLNLAGAYAPESYRDELMTLTGWGQVVEHGFVGRQEVAEILKRSFAGVVTLHPLRNYIDAQPIKMFEYMSAGIPVIASDFPLWKQIVEGAECGYCVDPLDPKAIAKAVERISSDPVRAREMGRNGRKAVEEKYNWQAEEKKLVAIYNGLA